MADLALLHLLQDENIILMGAPGSGKSTQARLLAQRLSISTYDIDDDHLENVWNCSVASKLNHTGDEGFLLEEGKALALVKKKSTVISLTGSNPLEAQCFESFLAANAPGLVVYMDVADQDIIQRLEAMKVDRIVGQSSRPMAEILRYRRQFYEKYYNLRVIIPRHATISEVADRLWTELVRFCQARFEDAQGGRYESTRSNTRQRLSYVVLQGLAPDGGLYMPVSIPKFTLSEIERLGELVQQPMNKNAYSEVALRVLEKFLPEVSPQTLRSFVQKAYHSDFGGFFDTTLSETPFVTQLPGTGWWLVELFQGPTGSFKDFALQLFPLLFAHFANTQKYAILVSTSGDTGSATIDGFCRHTEIPVIVLFPHNGVSPLQRAQMVSFPSSRLKVLAVDKADFDFCQTTTKQIFNDSSFTKTLFDSTGFSLSAANSINWCRLVPQIVYNFYVYLVLVNKGEIKLGETVDLCLPSGNFGNITAALFAKLSGLPIGRLISASNENDILNEFIASGRYDIRQRSLIRTASPSIDILKSSNLERMLYALLSSTTPNAKSQIAYGLIPICAGLADRPMGRARAWFGALDREKHFTIDDELLQRVKSIFWSGKCSEELTIKTMAETFQKSHILLDPHTAVAEHVANAYMQDSKATGPLLVYSTAHYAKFPLSALQALKHEPPKAGTAQKTLETLAGLLADGRVLPRPHRLIEQAARSTQCNELVVTADKTAIQQIVQGFLSAVK